MTKTEPAMIDLAMPTDAMAEAAWPRRRVARWALLLLLLAYMLSFVDRIILSILVGPIKADLNLSDTQFALISGVAFSMFYATIGMPIGWLVDRISRRWIVAGGIALWSLFTVASGLAPSFGWLFVARMGVGIGEAALSPAAYSLIADYFRPEHRGRAMATYTLGVSLGSSLAYVLGGMLIGFASKHGLIDLPGFGALVPWRYVFVVIGLPGLAMAALALTMREPARRNPPRDLVAPGRGLFKLMQETRAVTVPYLLGYSFINLPFAGFLIWGPALYGRVYGLGPAKLGLPLALIFLVPTTIGQLLGATITDRRIAAGHADAPFTTALICAILLVPAAIAMPLMPTGMGSLIVLAFLVALVCGSVGHHAVVAAIVAPNRLRGQYIAVFFFVQNVFGQAVIALITATLTDRVFGDPLSIGKSMAIVGGVGAIGGVIFTAYGRRALRAFSRA